MPLKAIQKFALLVTGALISAGLTGVLCPLHAFEDHTGKSEKVIVQASFSEKGTVVFTAINNGRPLPGVEIKINGNPGGATDEQGRLEKEWLHAGVNKWHAFYEGVEIEAGQLMVPETVKARIIDRGAVINGEKNRDKLKIRPFMEEWTGFVEVKNTGTTFIDHCEIQVACPMKGSESIRIDLISPSIPSWIWKPLMGDMLNLCTRRIKIAVINDHIDIKDAFTGDPVTVKKVYSSQPLTPRGLAPGETVLVEYAEPFSQCLNGFVYSVGARQSIDVETEIVSPQDGIMHMIIKQYKFIFFTFDKVIAELVFKGSGKSGECSMELCIDDNVYDSVPWVAWEWY